MSKAILVDGNNVVMRAYLAPKDDMSSGGVETGTLLLFVNIISRHIRMQRPDKGLVAWDGGSSAYRMRIFPEYKAARRVKYSDEVRPPFDIIQQFLRLAGVPQLQLPGYEGDDIISASWRACRGRERIFILSSDKDMLQLVEDGTEQIKLTSGQDRPDIWSKSRIISELGYRPEHIPMIMSLTGDKVDGIPGLPRVGTKTAVKMLKEHNWELSALVETLSRPDQERVLLNMALVDLSYVPLELDEPPDLDLVGPDSARWEDLVAFCDMYELKTIKAKLQAGSLWT